MPRVEYYRRRYESALAGMPKSGEAESFHNAIFGVAKLGDRAGLDSAKIFDDIFLVGGRLGHAVELRRNEIMRTIQKAIDQPQCFEGCDAMPKATSLTEGAEVRLENFKKSAAKGKGITAYDIWERSCPRPEGEPKWDGILFLEALFASEDRLCLTGESQCDTVVKTRGAWIGAIDSGRDFYSHLAINPLTGKFHPSSTGRPSRRCDGAVAAYKYVLAEFDPPRGQDTPSLVEQLAFWAVVKLPIAALVYSGGKSIHAFIALGVSVKTAEDWSRVVVAELYGKLLIPLGVDTGCRTPSHLGRLPGHLRSDRHRLQRLLYLNENPGCNGIF
jgi:hypothetical protein